jgi:hypothetical protein
MSFLVVGLRNLIRRCAAGQDPRFPAALRSGKLAKSNRQ